MKPIALICKITSVNTSKLKQSAVLFFHGFNHLLWPAVCINCKENISIDDGNLCKDCWQQLLACAGGDYCPRCGRDVSKYALLNDACPQCLQTDIHFDRIARSGIYAKSLRQMILALKNNKTELDSVLGFLADSALAGSGFYNDIDYFVPVPLHWRRRFFRGYNHSHLLAKRLKHPAAKINTDLVRIRHTKLQTTMSPAGRAKNVAGAFAVRRGHKFENRNICLVDDIKTSGATSNECAKTMKIAGAAKVYALVLAVAGQQLD